MSFLAGGCKQRANQTSKEGFEGFLPTVGDNSSRPEVLAVSNQLFLFGRVLIQSESSGGRPVPSRLSVCSATWTLARLHKKLARFNPGLIDKRQTPTAT